MIDLRVYGDPTACRAAATGVRSARTAIDDAVSQVSTVRSRSESAWEGQAADAFRGQVADLRRDLEELEQRAGTVATALDAFASELATVRSSMDHAREVAAAAGCPVNADEASEPTNPGPAAPEPQAAAYRGADAGYRRAHGIADDARAKETEAHANLESALASANGDGWLVTLLQKLGFAPPDKLDALGGTLWGLGLTGTGLGLGTDWMIKGRYGTFQPRLNGQFGSTSGMSFLERLQAAGREDSWHAKAYKAGLRGRWETAGKVAKYGGVAVSFATSAYGQWEQDADDPTLSTSEKVGRATAVGTSSAAGAWAGAEAGAWAGGAIGTAICPGVGTVIGGAVGGIVGGFAGSELGGWVGDHLKDVGGDVGQAVSDFAGHAADTVGDVASDVGDALTFWD